jgi:hypothetical protein
MPSYAFERQLSSYSVNRAFLIDSELFIRKKAEELLRETFDAKKYKIQIQDSLGTQTLESIDEFQYSQFPNDTKSIRLEYQHYDRKVDFTFALQLDVNPSFSSVKITLSGDSPRQHVLGIAAELDHLLDSYKNRHFCGNLPTL